MKEIGDTNCTSCDRNNLQMTGKGTRRFGNKRSSRVKNQRNKNIDIYLNLVKE